MDQITKPQGASAQAIWAHLCNGGESDGSYPHDSADFGRCEAFLDAHPRLRADLPRMAEVNAYWAALVPEWDAMRRMAGDERYARLKAILGPIEDADPDHVRLGGASLRFGKCSFKGAPPVDVPEDQLDSVLTTHLKAAFTSKRKPKDRQPMKDDPDFRKHNQQAFAVTADELRQFIERYEQLESEKKDIADQQKELMAEAKGRGYDTRVMRKVIALRKRKPDDVAEEDAVLDLYKTALGMT